MTTTYYVQTPGRDWSAGNAASVAEVAAAWRRRGEQPVCYVSVYDARMSLPPRYSGEIEVGTVKETRQRLRATARRLEG